MKNKELIQLEIESKIITNLNDKYDDDRNEETFNAEEIKNLNNMKEIILDGINNDFIDNNYEYKLISNFENFITITTPCTIQDERFELFKLETIFAEIGAFGVEVP